MPLGLGFQIAKLPDYKITNFLCDSVVGLGSSHDDYEF